MSAQQDTIKELAYRLWQEAGSPEGRDMDFWLQAEAQVKAAKPAKAPAKPRVVETSAPAKDAPKAKAPAKPKSAAKPKATAAKPKAAAKA